MLTRVDIQNYRSIHEASIPLSPFTLLIGANGTGKSNFLQLLKDVSIDFSSNYPPGETISTSWVYPAGEKLPKHQAFTSEHQSVKVFNDQQEFMEFEPEGSGQLRLDGQVLAELDDVRIFSLTPQKAGIAEQLVPVPTIQEDGAGIVQVLDSLKTGDREDLFDRIEELFMQYIPEVEKLSFIPNQNAKQLQVRERYLPTPTPVSALSEGMQLALILISILYQETKPSLVCIEDIDRGLHPRLFQSIVELCFDLSNREDGVQIIATTHNPYLVDEFTDHEEAVVIVEKENGQTKFTTLSEKLEAVGSIEEPLGSLWVSGLVGGVPSRV